MTLCIIIPCDSLLPLGFDGSIILGVSEQVAVKVGRPVLLKCDVTVTPGDSSCTNLAKVVGWKWNTANKGMKLKLVWYIKPRQTKSNRILINS